jgi:hypothetical protein
MFKRNLLPLFGLVLPLALAGGGCSADLAKANGTCVVNASLDCGVSGPDGGADLPAGLTGYSCDGTARPDDNAHYYDGVPQGAVCADNGTTPDGKRNFCCTPPTTSCAYNPVSSCTDQNYYGFQCYGSTRPDALNPALNCGNGVDNGNNIDYCCSAEMLPPSQTCTALKGGICPPQLTPFSCPGTALPRAELFGMSESRADYYRPLCSMPIPLPNPNQKNYCCYMPALIPDGGSCVQDTTVPGCGGNPNQFGFACYGPENPHDDYLPMQCNSPGVKGMSAEGYPATLYCCDFVATAAASTTN